MGYSSFFTTHEDLLMFVTYFYCNSCGYEDFDINVVYSRQTANGEWCYCPACQQESSNFEEEEVLY